MNMLSQSIQELNSLYIISKKVSIIDIGPTAKALRTFQLEKIVEKILLHDHSILVLFENGIENKNEMDISLIASAARNTMECTNIYFHIAERNLDPDEIQFRFLMMYINAIKNELDIYHKLNISLDNYRVGLYKWSFDNSIEEIKNIKSFKKLSDKERQFVVSDRKPAFKIKSPNIIQTELESALYNLLSNSVHSLFIGLGNNSLNPDIFYSSYFDPILLLNVAIQISIIYTSYVIKDYLELRKRLYRFLDENEKQVIKELKSTNRLVSYLDSIKKDFDSASFSV